MASFDTIYKASVIGTFITLIWYTIETARIRKINTKQKDLQLLPAMMIYMRQHSGTERPFIRNIGFGTAFAVEVLPSTVKEAKVYDFRFDLADGNNTLVPEEERQIGVNVDVNGKYDTNTKPLPTFAGYYFPPNLQMIEAHKEAGATGTIANLATERGLIVHFKDITGQKYETSINFSANGISVKKAPKRVGGIAWRKTMRI
ncbi:MAG: hypothetical protein ACREGG_04600 [Candidatus Saccharimonadales bacterium]